MIRKLLIILGITMLLTVTTTTGKFFGFSNITTASSLLIVFLMGIDAISGKYFAFKVSNTLETRYLLLVVVISLFQYVIYGIEKCLETINVWFLPVFIFLYMKSFDSVDKRIIRYVLIVFFITECSLAIFERVYQYNIFPYISEDNINPYFSPELWELRSSSFWGHPLLNANIVSILMAFILLDKYLKRKYLLVFYILGILALLSFNARGATLIWIFLSIVFYFKFYKALDKHKRWIFILVSLTIVSFFYVLILNSSFGGRLINEKKIFDGSAQTRVAAYNIFQSLSTQEILQGDVSLKKYTENGYINICLKYGFIFGFSLILFQNAIIFKCLKKLNKVDKLILFISCIGVGLLNNNLSNSSIFMFFLLCSISFKNINTQTPNRKTYNDLYICNNSSL